jgi:CRP-like cAMP-binding protein
MVPYFNSWSKMRLLKFSYFFAEKTYIKKQVIFKENDPCNDIYLISSGEVKFTKTVTLDQDH